MAFMGTSDVVASTINDRRDDGAMVGTRTQTLTSSQQNHVDDARDRYR